MPPRKKVLKEDVIKAALNILSLESIDSLNARRLAKELNCSVQPIFYNFSNMEELKVTVLNEIYKIYQEFMINGTKVGNAYKGMGLAYINFARKYPNYFKLIFMNKTDMTPEVFISNDDFGNSIIKEGMKFTGLTQEEQKAFHLKVWIFTHGLDSLVATNTVKITDEEIEKLLTESVKELLIGKRKES